MFTKGLNFGVDFKGGTTIELRLEKQVEIEKIRKLRNDTVHLNVLNTRAEAEQALKFAKKIIRNTNLSTQKTSKQKFENWILPTAT